MNINNASKRWKSIPVVPPEEVETDLLNLVDENGFLVVKSQIGESGQTWHGLKPQDADRIVACMNLCREFPTHALAGIRLKYMANAAVDSRTISDMPGFAGYAIVVEDKP